MARRPHHGDALYALLLTPHGDEWPDRAGGIGDAAGRAEAVEVVNATAMLQEEVCGPADSMRKMAAHEESSPKTSGNL